MSVRLEARDLEKSLSSEIASASRRASRAPPPSGLPPSGVPPSGLPAGRHTLAIVEGSETTPNPTPREGSETVPWKLSGTLWKQRAGLGGGAWQPRQFELAWRAAGEGYALQYASL